MGIKTDNRWENLREAKNHKENGENRKTSKSNKSGYTGVSWHKGGQKWAAQIKSEGKIYHLGSYDDPKEAYEAYLVAKQKYHKFQPIPREQTNGTRRTGMNFVKHVFEDLDIQTIDINLSNEAIEDRIDEALGYFLDFFYDGSEKTYLRTKLLKMISTINI